MSDTPTTQQAMTEIASQSPEAAGMVGAILAASAEQTFNTMDRLYESEKRRRQVLEALIDETLERLEHAHMGSAREYEAAVYELRFGGHGREEQLLARHRENFSL